MYNIRGPEALSFRDAGLGTMIKVSTDLNSQYV
jgi:hypothetical protein